MWCKPLWGRAFARYSTISCEFSVCAAGACEPFTHCTAWCMHYWLHCGHASSHKPNHKLLVAVSEVPLSCDADLCSCLSFRSSPHSAFVSYLWTLPLSYLAALLIDDITSLTGCLSLFISPNCSYTFILEFLLICLWLFFLSPVSPCLSFSHARPHFA